MVAHLIAIEGLDGSGKGTQLARLEEELERRGRTVATVAFPSYDRGLLGRKVGEYLDGRLGRLAAEQPWLPALLFAADRFEHRGDLRDHLVGSDVLLVDRYVASNIAFQAVRLDPPALAEFAAWLDELEFGVFGLPRPSLQFYLRMPPATARRLVLQKKKRTYTDRELDLYERDLERQSSSARIYEWLAETGFGGPWKVVEAADETGEPLSRERVTGALLAAVEGLLEPLAAPDPADVPALPGDP